MHCNETWAISWRAGLAALLIAALVGLASHGHSQSPEGVLGVFGFSLFASLGFLLFGQRRFDVSPSRKAPANPPDGQRNA